MSLSPTLKTHWFATALRRIGTLAMLLVGSTLMAQTGEKVEDGRPNEIKVGKYHVLTIEPAYDIRLSDAMVKLDQMYSEDYKSLTNEQKAALRDAKKVSSEARARRTEAMKTIRRVLSGEQSVDQNRARMDYWFKRVVFPEMTQLDATSLGELPNLRSTFSRDYFQKAQKIPAVHSYLTQMTFDELKYIAERDFHPAARYHAVLMIGQLNSREPVLLGSPKSAPVPYQPALDYLIGLYQNDKLIEPVRVAALLGVTRHAELLGANMPEEDRNKVIDAMLATLDAEPGNRTESGHAWVQRRAIEVLGTLQNVGAGGKVAKRLKDVIEDPAASVSLRCSAAVAYGNLTFTNEVEPKAATVAAIVGKLIANECRARLDWLEQEQEEMKKRLPSDMGYGAESSSYDGMGAEGGVITATPADSSSAPGGDGYSSGGFSPVGPMDTGMDESYGASSVDPERAATELEKHRLAALRRRIKYPVFCAQLALGAKVERGTIRLPTDHGLRRYLSDKDESDFVDALARQLNNLQDAANAGMEKKEEVNSRIPSRTPVVTAEEEKLPTELFKEELLLAVRKVEDALSKAPASVQSAIAEAVPEPDDSSAGPLGPEPSGPVDPTAAPPAAPAGPATTPAGPAAGPPGTPAGPPAGPAVDPAPPAAP